MKDPQKDQLNSQNSISEAWNNLWIGIKAWFIALVDLKEGMDREGTIISIKSGKMMSGANAWMLICSIMIASLGLDLNSSAVIIGAMLISPLMSPILGIGLGIGTNDRETLFTAIKQFAISILIALITSTIYFKLTPLGSFTDMIAARTAPTLLDGFVAIFGGLAGIISITRKDKSNAIPGVAIATALMPPLCVTGYGIATNDTQIALNSFYLFFLNSFFIALTSYFIIRLLKFPFKEHPDAREGQRARIMVVIFSLILIIPAINIFRDVIKDLRYKQAVKNFVDTNFGTDCINHRTFNINPDSNLLVVQLINRDIPDSLRAIYSQKLSSNEYLSHTALQALPDYRFQLEELDKKALEFKQIDVISNRLENLHQKQLLEEKRDSIQNTLLARHNQLDSLQWNRLSQSIHNTKQFSIIDTILYGETSRIDFNKSAAKEINLFLVHWANRPTNKTKRRQEQNLKNYLSNYFEIYDIELDTFVVLSYN